MSKDEEKVEPAAQKDDANWQFNAEGSDTDSTQSELGTFEPISWTALEFIPHDKNQAWYVGLGGITIVLAIIVYFISSHDIVATAIVIVVAATFGFSASRKPRELTFQLDNDGLHIADRIYPFTGFKSFAVVQESGVQSVWLMPLRRFMPIIPIYFRPEDENKIVDTLAAILPFEAHVPDGVDRLMQRVRF